MKKELNEKFKEKFPSVNLTLTKLRSLKTEIRRIGIECDVDTVTIAQVWSPFYSETWKQREGVDYQLFFVY